MTASIPPGQTDFRSLPAWRQARHLALAIVAVTDGFPRTELARHWARRIEQTYLTMLLNIVAVFEQGGSAGNARKSIDRIETALQQAHKKKLMARSDLLRLSRELDSVRTLLADQEAPPPVDDSHSPSHSQSFIPISLGVSHD